MTRFVSFVGSGPGDPELLTVKAVNRLKTADVVLYDDLSSGPILDLINPAADLVSVGKRAGRPSPKQRHVSQLLVDHAQPGLKVVRLKSGDSGMFGRLEEEITALKAEGIGYEIIPGVTSAFAAAAGAGIPLTRRETARRVQFFTGHGVTGELPEDINIAALADPKVMSVIYMGKGTFEKLAKMLIAAGMPADMPAMLAINVSHPNQRYVRSTISEMGPLIEAEAGKDPALILMGPMAEGPDD